MKLAFVVLSMILTSAVLAVPLYSQQMQSQNQSQSQNSDQQENTIEGTVVSTSAHTLVVKADEGNYLLFTFDTYTQKPKAISSGTRVRVISNPTDREGVRLASIVTVLTTSAADNNATAGTQAKPLPPEERRLENDIKQDARRWHVGVRAGAALDPELFMFGVHSQIGPIFSHNVFFRPNAEFAFGEVTDLIALNLEAIYRFPVSTRNRYWSAYVGAGPGFTFLHQSFEHNSTQGRDISFSNLDFKAGFNILAGIQRRHMFYEMKTSLFSQPAPVFRLIVGYTF
jgi:hypothetical protein